MGGAGVDGAGGGVYGGGVNGCILVVVVGGAGVGATVGTGVGFGASVGPPSVEDPGIVKSEPDKALVWPLPLI